MKLPLPTRIFFSLSLALLLCLAIFKNDSDAASSTDQEAVVGENEEQISKLEEEHLAAKHNR